MNHQTSTGQQRSFNCIQNTNNLKENDKFVGHHEEDQCEFMTPVKSL